MEGKSWTLPAAAAAETGALELAYASAAGYVSEMDALRAEAANLFANIKSEILEKIPGGILAALLRATNPAMMNEAMTQLHAQIRMAEQTVDKEHMHYFQEVAAHNAEYRAQTDAITAHSAGRMAGADARADAMGALAKENELTTPLDAQVKAQEEALAAAMAANPEGGEQVRAEEAKLQQLRAQQYALLAAEARKQGLPAVAAQFDAASQAAQDDFQAAMVDLRAQQQAYLAAQDRLYVNDPEKAQREREIAENGFAKQNKTLEDSRNVSDVDYARDSTGKRIQLLESSAAQLTQQPVVPLVNVPESVAVAGEPARMEMADAPTLLSSLPSPTIIRNKPTSPEAASPGGLA